MTENSTPNRVGPVPLLTTLICLVTIVLSIRSTQSQQTIYLDPPVRNVPHGAVSLVFVFDTTGSMEDDLNQVIEGAQQILSTALDKREKIIYNYILIPFNDPDVGPAIVTTDPSFFQQSLQNIRVVGGGDCPEMCLGGIKLALEKALPNSFIYVFTDASAKDHSMVEDILTIIQVKQSQIIFALTGDCGAPNSVAFRVFDDIASTSSGQVFNLHKDEVNKVLDYVKSTLHSQKVNLFSVNGFDDESLVILLVVDSQIDEFTTSVTGVGAGPPSIVLLDPTGKQLKPDEDYEIILVLKNALTVTVKDPIPGDWKLSVNATGKHTIRITGLSKVDFIYGFSILPTSNLTETHSIPAKDVLNYLLINCKGMDNGSTVEQIELVDFSGNLLMSPPLTQDPSLPHLYQTSFVPPTEYFYIKIRGTDERGLPFQRTTPTAISSSVPHPPTVHLPFFTWANLNDVVNMTCHVTSAMPFSVKWYRDNEYISNTESFYRFSSDVTLHLRNVTNSSDGTYSCVATNEAGTNQSSTVLKVQTQTESQPNIESLSSKVYISPGQSAVLSCTMYTDMPHKLIWYKRELDSANSYPVRIDEKKFVHLKNGSLVIEKVNWRDEVEYMCWVASDGSIKKETIQLILHRAPELQLEKEIHYLYNKSVTIDCTSNTIPQPTFTWLRNEEEVTNSTNRTFLVDHNTGTLVIVGARREDEGTWWCRATNEIGSSSAPIHLEFFEEPTILEGRREVVVIDGDDATLECRAVGHPEPRITWSRHGVLLQELDYLKLTEEGDLIISKVNSLDSGEYQCIAHNEAGTAIMPFKIDVGVAPTMTKSPVNSVVDIHKNITLSCTSSGFPAPNITWYWNEQVIDFTARKRHQVLNDGSLFIQNAQKEDEGLYLCIATNKFGSSQKSAFIEITGIIPPEISNLYPQLDILKGRELKLKCNIISGYPKPRVTWYAKGKVVETETLGISNVTDLELFIDAAGNLVIPLVDEEDEGEYSCVASNVGGQATMVVQLDVKVHPRILPAPHIFTVTENEQLTLPCEVIGDPKPKVWWSKNGDKIAETDSHYFVNENNELLLFSALKSDSGSYTCSAENEIGTALNFVEVLVHSVPKILGPKEYEVDVSVGKPLLMPCQFTGAPTPTFKWLFNGVEINLDEEKYSTTSSIGSLLVNNVEMKDAGLYRCLVENLVGSDHVDVHFNVNMPPIFKWTNDSSPPMINHTIIVNQDLTLTCEVIGKPPPNIEWKKDSILLEDNHKYLISTEVNGIEVNSTLVVKNTDTKDAGYFTCAAENYAGLSLYNFNVVVHEQPRIDNLTSDLSVMENNQIVLPCHTVQGTPKPTIKWYKNGPDLTEPIDLSDPLDPSMTLLKDGSLQIDNAKGEYSGVYKCEAVNEVGSDEFEVLLKVLVPPKFKDEDDHSDADDMHDSKVKTLSLKQINIVKGNKIHLNCHVHAIPHPTLTWYKNGEELRAHDDDLEPRILLVNSSQELVVEMAKGNDSARYTCVANNVAGSAEKNFDLDVHIPPFFEDAIKDDKDDDDDDDDDDEYEDYSALDDMNEITTLHYKIINSPISFQCPAQGNPTPDITWFKNDQPIAPDTGAVVFANGRQLELKSVGTSDEGAYRCVATNEAGTISKSFELQVQVPPSIDLHESTLDTEVMVGSQISLECPTQGSPPPKIQWLKDGKVSNASELGAYFEDDDESVLSFHSAEAKHSGKYSCVATNEVGQDERHFNLNVLVVPYIDRNEIIQDPVVIIDQSIIITCPVSGTPHPHIQWFKNGMLISEELFRNVQILLEGRQLRISNAYISDAGNYRCVASNKAGHDNVDFKLSVHVPANIDKSRLNRQPSVLLGQTVELSCPVVGVPHPKVTWHKDGVELYYRVNKKSHPPSDGTDVKDDDDEEDYRVEYLYTDEEDVDVSNELDSGPVSDPNGNGLKIEFEGRRLTLKVVDIEDGGSYECKAENEAGADQVTYDLKILVPPSINKLTNVNPEILNGHTTMLLCHVKGHPAPTVHWLKNGYPIDVTNQNYLFLERNQRIEILRTTIDDSGDYSCMVENEAGVDDLHFNLKVLVPPQIDTTDLNQNPKSLKGSVVHLHCPVHGVPFPNITWFRNDLQILETDSKFRIILSGRQLEILMVDVDDAVSYVCIATNVVGQASQAFYLTVQAPPEIDKASLLTNLQIHVNETVTLECQVNGTPIPTITWLIDGRPIDQAVAERDPHSLSAINVLSDGFNLEIKHVQPTDAGRYTCIATNEVGEEKKDFYLTIQVPPRIEKQETTTEPIIIRENGTTYLSCQVTGSPTPTILWFKDGVPLLDLGYANAFELNGGRELKLWNVNVDDSGLFECEASNEVGKSRKEFQLVVLEPPRILLSHEIPELTILVGDEMTLSCPMQGESERQVTWFKDGRPILEIPELVSKVRTLSDDTVLAIYNMEVENSGSYGCEAVNIAGYATKSFNVLVMTPPTLEGSHLIDDRDVLIGSVVTLECQVTGNPEPTIEWSHNDEPYSFIIHSNMRILREGKLLELYNVQLQDAGTYACYAHNLAGSVTKEYTINVIVPPIIEEGSKLVAGVVGTRAFLPCEVSGLPKPEVTWVKNGYSVPILEDGKYSIQRAGSLFISQLDVDDTGNYRCSAKNSAGHASRDIQLNVQVPPKIEQPNQIRVQAAVGGSVDLTCPNSGVPKPRVSWQKGSRLLMDAQGYQQMPDDSLRISSLEAKDAGVYVCLAQNNAGSALGQVRLEVQVPPTIDEPADPTVEVIQGNEVLLQCISKGLPEPSIQWEKDGWQVLGINTRYKVLPSGFLAIYQISDKDSGIYSCKAENIAGVAKIEYNLNVLVPPTIEEFPRLLTVIEGQPLNVPCMAEGTPTPVVEWYHKGDSVLEYDVGHGVVSAKKAGQNYVELIIGKVEVKHKGSYMCLAKNEAGRDSREFKVQVQVPPQVKVHGEHDNVVQNGRIVLQCSASGIPPPNIKWTVNGVNFDVMQAVMKKNRIYKVRMSTQGHSQLTIDEVGKHDSGAYECQAFNSVGNASALVDIHVKAPPKVLMKKSEDWVTEGQSITLECPLEANDLTPTIIWTKNYGPLDHIRYLVDDNELDTSADGNVISQDKHGNLIIQSASIENTGVYKCTATNIVGSSEGTIILTVNYPPKFKIQPISIITDQSSTITFDCAGEGEPEPKVTWVLDDKPLNNRFSLLPNNSLRIVAVQAQDTNTYGCMLKNELGTAVEYVSLTVKVHGQYSQWSGWSECSALCGDGTQTRTRTCTNPAPQNGGTLCQGPSNEERFCMPQPCPIDGVWSEWTPWTDCSQSCGDGFKTRVRDCNNPHPQFGGRHCSGDNMDKVVCNTKPCPIHGLWSSWSEWNHCSESCGEGVQERLRSCDHPQPQHGGDDCSGVASDKRACKVTDCEVNGSWGSWTEWSSCTLSCGGGMRKRERRCDNPPPSSEGKFCPGSDQQIDYCNKEECPVHGKWAEWSPWGDCTLTCGGGQRRRFRTCTNPVPKHNGRACIGVAQETDVCNSQRCAVDGEWSTWSVWTECSQSCEGGTQERRRVCRQPQYGGVSCLGDPNQIKKCNTHPCKANSPQSGQASIVGTLNGQLVDAKMQVNVSRLAEGTLTTGYISDVPSNIVHKMKPLVSLLAPVYWATAVEVGKAMNGFSLTRGNFQKDSHVEFINGDIVTMSQSAHGIDADGVLNYNVELDGNVVDVDEDGNVTFIPFIEDLVQVKKNMLFSQSLRSYQQRDDLMPYKWNHTVTYNQSLGKMPYLVERLVVERADVHFDRSTNQLQFNVLSHISKGEPSNQCPKGFLLDSDGPYCRDEDECATMQSCTHFCINTMGSYMCSCPNGFKLDINGRSCNDIDECEDKDDNECAEAEECINSIGSYRCLERCDSGFRRSFLNHGCEDINECAEIPNLCAQVCTNLPGSYRCSCKGGYKLTSASKCEDVNECKLKTHKCSHRCINTAGSYRCTCPSGYRKSSEHNCTDIDECLENLDNCVPGQVCKNRPGGFTCINTCPTGFNLHANGSCIDVDECRSATGYCKSPQICLNTIGSYVCICPRGFKRSNTKQLCIDKNECMENRNLCMFKCENTIGSYRCMCPPNNKLLADGRSCAPINQDHMLLYEPHQSHYTVQPWSSQRSAPRLPRQHNCPLGFKFIRNKCVDVNECHQPDICQHDCQNIIGSYRCLCPPGFRLAPDMWNCTDINECKERLTPCSPDKQCFNTLGGFECIEVVCPEGYVMDPISKFCTLDCDTCEGPHTIQFYHLSLPLGYPNGSKIIKLMVYNQDGVHLSNTTFTVDRQGDSVPFNIYVEDGVGIVYATEMLLTGGQYELTVESRSVDPVLDGVVYWSRFTLHIYVSEYSYE